MLNQLESYKSLPEGAKLVVMALGVITERIATLSRADRDDLYELVGELAKTDDSEEQSRIQRAMEEILAQEPITISDVKHPKNELGSGLARWADHVAGAIKKLRTQAGMTQAQLAEKAGMTQAHISRLEQGQHTATNLTLVKIANALGVEVGQIDPCVD